MAPKLVWLISLMTPSIKVSFLLLHDMIIAHSQIKRDCDSYRMVLNDSSRGGCWGASTPPVEHLYRGNLLPGEIILVLSLFIKPRLVLVIIDVALHWTGNGDVRGPQRLVSYLSYLASNWSLRQCAISYTTMKCKIHLRNKWLYTTGFWSNHWPMKCLTVMQRF